ncbi:spermidine/putrescine ABC transporter permease [Actinokineospora bangkokensis]|uniref:Spermidine/putrescine ABC transporter permease n=1 Tax=Actinokineospora bangkokensis TaxID=1193682 RepID=A0A1Q9LM69_9PSEU|nr:spermidine/putrescine ABC transporter permease [Actinokineospora bangkokensis]
MSPWLVGVVVFTIAPMAISLWLSFTRYDMLTSPEYVGADNYAELLGDPKVATALWNTAFFTVLHVPAQIVLALGLAGLVRKAGRAAGFFRTVLYLPVMTPPVALAAMFLLLLNGQTGAINDVLGWFGFTGPNWTTDPDWVKPGLVLMSLWTVGSTAVILLAALSRVPPELLEAAALDGAGPWRRFWHVTLPQISGTLYFVVLVNTIASLQVFTEAYVMFYGNAQTEAARDDSALFYVVYLFQQAFGSLRMGYASALAWVLFLVIAVITAVQVRVSRRLVHYEGEPR